MRKVVINTRYGGFGLSHEACVRLRELGGEVVLEGELYPNGLGPAQQSHELWGTKRDDPRLVQVVEELGSDGASGPYAHLKIAEIPEDVDWEIQEYDGKEWIAEAHRTWG